MPQYDETNKGVLFQNDRKTKDNQPDYKGKINVNGVELELAGWKRTPNGGGKPFLSLSVQAKREVGQ